MNQFKKTNRKCLIITFLFGTLYSLFYITLYYLFLSLYLQPIYSLIISIGFTIFNITLSKTISHSKIIDSNDYIKVNDKFFLLFKELREISLR